MAHENRRRNCSSTDGWRASAHAGHHVVWLPTNQEKLEFALRIFETLEEFPAIYVARTLMAERIPSPDAGRRRPDRNGRHQVSGVWHQNTVINIGTNPLLAAIATYGRRSMGKLLRFAPDGPRSLEAEDDYRDDQQPRIIQNTDHISAVAKFEPRVAPERLERLRLKLNSLEAAKELFDLVNTRLFLRFGKSQPKKRITNRVDYGMVTLGAEPSPIEIYSGHTARKHIKSSRAAGAANPGNTLAGLPGDVSSDGLISR